MWLLITDRATTSQTTVRTFRLTEDLDGQAGTVFFINDERWPFNIPIDVTLGATEIWEIVNDNDHEHPFHIHGHFVQVLGTEPLGWKDTIVVAARSTVRDACTRPSTLSRSCSSATTVPRVRPAASVALVSCAQCAKSPPRSRAEKYALTARRPAGAL